MKHTIQEQVKKNALKLMYADIKKEYSNIRLYANCEVFELTVNENYEVEDFDFPSDFLASRYSKFSNNITHYSYNTEGLLSALLKQNNLEDDGQGNYLKLCQLYINKAKKMILKGN